jgi:hypothetical protein
MLCRVLGALGFTLALAVACGGSTSGSGIADGGAGMSGSGGGTAGSGGSGGGSSGCPDDPWNAEGTACPEPGKICGGPCEPCSFCNLLVCENGRWSRREGRPAPGCLDAGNLCGGWSGQGCPDGFYCDFASGCGFADQQGVCISQPDGCPKDCPGVCGCDGQFYCNRCSAAQAGVDVDDGSSACLPDAGARCGGLLGEVCAGDEFCDLPDGCGFPDAQGICKKRPDACPEDCPGVCGCDRQRYCNVCSANMVGVDTSNGTECSTGDGGAGTLCGSDFECAPGLKCCYPCGIPGCENQCMTPAPDGHCPLFP